MFTLIPMAELPVNDRTFLHDAGLLPMTVILNGSTYQGYLIDQTGKYWGVKGRPPGEGISVEVPAGPKDLKPGAENKV